MGWRRMSCTKCTLLIGVVNKNTDSKKLLYKIRLQPQLTPKHVRGNAQTMKISSIVTFLLSLFIHTCSATKSALTIPNTGMKASIEQHKTSIQIPQSAKLIIGAGGIYAAFLYYGTLQEEVFHYKAEDGSKFKAAWFLQFLGWYIYGN